METFGIDLWNNIKNLYSDKDEELNKKIFFGLAPEDTSSPYCVIHVLNCGEDSSAQTLCQYNENYNIVGSARIQFTIYAQNDMWLDEIREDLNKKIRKLQDLTKYRILSKVLLRSKNASSFSSEIGTGLTEFEFKYESL